MKNLDRRQDFLQFGFERHVRRRSAGPAEPSVEHLPGRLYWESGLRIAVHTDYYFWISEMRAAIVDKANREAK